MRHSFEDMRDLADEAEDFILPSGTPVDDWLEPLDLMDPERPPFPVRAMPDWTRRFIRDCAASVGTSDDLVGTAVLGALSGALAKKFTVQANESHGEPLGLYVCCATPPGDGKSPALNHVLQPFYEWEAREQERRGPEVAVAQRHYDRAKKQIDAKEREALQETTPEIRKALELEADTMTRDLSGQTRPEVPKIITNNFTPPALARIMAQNHGRMIVATDEANELFAILAGKHTNGTTDATLFKQAWSESPYLEERVGREGTQLRRPLLNVVAMVQPDALRAMQRRSELAGLGVLDRILFTMPISRMAPPDPAPLAEEVRSTFGQCVTRLLEMDVPDEARPLRLSSAAKKALVGFRLELNQRTFEGQQLHGFQGIASKLKANAARIAGTLHVAKHASNSHGIPDELDEETMQRAVEIGDYFAAQSPYVLGFMDADPALLAAHKVWRCIERKQLAGAAGDRLAIRKQDIWQNTKGKRGPIQTIADLDRALDLLHAHHYLRRTEDRAETFAISPKALRRGADK